MGSIPLLTEQEFLDLIQSTDKPVLIDMYADWCKPCKAIAPVMERFNEQYGDRIHFVKVDIDAHPGVSMRYKVMSIPTFLMIKNGEVVDTLVGAIEKKLHEMIERQL